MSKQTEEQSSNFFIFGNREIFPIGYVDELKSGATEKKDLGVFKMSNGALSLPAKYRDTLRTWIPKDVSNKNGGVFKEPTFEQVLIFFGELHFGAKWNSELNIFIEDDESQKWRAFNHKDKLKIMRTFPAMNVSQTKLMNHPEQDRFKFSDEMKTKLKSYEGFDDDKHRYYKGVVEAYNSDKLKKLKIINGEVKLTEEDMENIFPDPKTTQQRLALRKPKAIFASEDVEETDIALKNFKNIKLPDGFPYMEEYKNNLIKLRVTKWKARITGAFAVFLINNMVSTPYDLTVGMEKKTDNEKKEMMSDMVSRYRRWGTEYYTNEDFYKEEWTDDLTGKKMSFAPNIWEELADYPYREHKRGLPRKYIGEKKEDAYRKKASDMLASFTKNAPQGNWDVGKVPPDTILSKGTGIAHYSKQGQNIDDIQIRLALKFLETGQRHMISQKKHKGKKVWKKLEQYNDDGSVTEIKDIVIDFVPDPTDKEIHYNNTLKEYDWGSPFTPTAPASLFFRLALLTGWRKTEALTCPTREVSKAFLEQVAEGILKTGENPSGIFMEDGNLHLAFLTRKTQKTGDKYFHAIIPPFSSDTMDTRETIALVMKHAGLGKWKSDQFFNYIDMKDWHKTEIKKLEENKPTDPKQLKEWEEKLKEHKEGLEEGGFFEEENENWTPDVMEFNEKEKRELYPEFRRRGRKGIKVIHPKGVPSQLVIGWEGQFYPEDSPTEVKGKFPKSYDVPIGDDLEPLEDDDMVNAYLNYPLRECYRLMEGARIKKFTNDQITKQALEDRTHDASIKIFDMDDSGWATICSTGCKEKDIGEEAKGEYTHDRMDQDYLRYDPAKGEQYWIQKPNHSMRHVFAQLWLSKSDWNFGVVADRGHWDTLDTLKKSYGGMDTSKLAGFMIQVLSKDQVGKNKDNQQMNKSTAKRIIKSGVAIKIAENLTKERELTEKQKGEVDPEKEKEKASDRD